MGKFFDAQRHETPKLKIELPRFQICPNYLQVGNQYVKQLKSLSSGQHFPHYKSIVAISYQGNQFWPDLPKT